MSNIEYRSNWYDESDINILLDVVKPGDLLEFDRKSYSHWAVVIHVCGRSTSVVHRVGSEGVVNESLRHYGYGSLRPGSRLVKGDVDKDTLLNVLENDRVRIDNSRDKYQTPLSPDAIVRMAVSSIGDTELGEYNLVTNNCEHFAKMCRFGIKRSDQVRTVMQTGAGILAGIAAFCAVAAQVGKYCQTTDCLENSNGAKKDDDEDDDDDSKRNRKIKPAYGFEPKQ